MNGLQKYKYSYRQGKNTLFKPYQATPLHYFSNNQFDDKIICTPGTWDSHSITWSANEQSIIYQNGEIVEPKHDNEYANLLLDDDGINEGFNLNTTNAEPNCNPKPTQQNRNDSESS